MNVHFLLLLTSTVAAIHKSADDSFQRLLPAAWRGLEGADH